MIKVSPANFKKNNDFDNIIVTKYEMPLLPEPFSYCGYKNLNKKNTIINSVIKGKKPGIDYLQDNR